MLCLVQGEKGSGKQGQKRPAVDLKSNWNKKQNVKCYNCNQWGHFSDQCPKKSKKQKY